MILTRQLLGLAVRSVCMQHYKMFTKAAKAIGVSEERLTSAWSRDIKKSMRMDSMILMLDKLGYEVHFNIVRKGSES